MTIVNQVSDLATDVASEFNTVRAERVAVTGLLASLTTTDKANLVAAINEIAAAVGSAAGIDDNTTSTSSTWSSSKTDAQIAAAITALVGGAPGALDTLKEIADALAADDSAIDALTSALAQRVRVDAAQTFTAPQQAQARTNIGAQAAAEIGDTTTDFVAIFRAGLA